LVATFPAQARRFKLCISATSPSPGADEGDDAVTLVEVEDALAGALDDLLDILLRGSGARPGSTSPLTVLFCQPFAVFTLLQARGHGGDQAAAVAALGQEHFGSPSTNSNQAPTL
jgi:hypothetical protein